MSDKINLPTPEESKKNYFKLKRLERKKFKGKKLRKFPALHKRKRKTRPLYYVRPDKVVKIFSGQKCIAETLPVRMDVIGKKYEKNPNFIYKTIKLNGLGDFVTFKYGRESHSSEAFVSVHGGVHTIEGRFDRESARRWKNILQSIERRLKRA